MHNFIEIFGAYLKDVLIILYCSKREIRRQWSKMDDMLLMGTKKWKCGVNIQERSSSFFGERFVVYMDFTQTLITTDSCKNFFHL